MMAYKNSILAPILMQVDLGSSIAEQDNLLENARVETSAFTDLLYDKVDLIPGTKGSGKSALYRIFVDFLAESLLESRKVVIAHGVQRSGDQVFRVFNDRFKQMNEQDFINFWCIYFISLAHEHFVKNEAYQEYLKDCNEEVRAFRQACYAAGIPEFEHPKNLRAVLEWAIEVVKHWKPALKYRPPGQAGEFEVDLFGNKPEMRALIHADKEKTELPRYASNVHAKLQDLLRKSQLSLWLMIDRLDEIFQRRSPLETRALRGLLRTLRIFQSSSIRVKIFLRDDILSQVVSNGKGFTALTHITARQADTLRWSEDQILSMIVNRLFSSANHVLTEYLEINIERLAASQAYREEAFYQVFPTKVHPGVNQSKTLRWIYNHTQDANGVVTPRDVIDLLTKAKQHQQDQFMSNPSGFSESVIDPPSIKYGLEQLSRRKVETYIQAEFPQLWKSAKKFKGGKTEYTREALRRLFGNDWENTAKDLISIGVLKTAERKGKIKSYKIPFLYKEGLGLTQGKMS
ncbi:hypothetical protein KAX17_04885 [Candidatus Bipolaricaulota bacterium]|nr:hypothetical protein [Candidatus Bipolaricaulota bacterium]